ncbi:hypothetical protein IAT38_007183 [Cryptococcus sp. DSM 104549]
MSSPIPVSPPPRSSAAAPSSSRPASASGSRPKPQAARNGSASSPQAVIDVDSSPPPEPASPPQLAQADVEEKRIAESRRRQVEDTKKNHVEPDRPARPQDDWQVTYIWAFITKFNLRHRIPRLKTIEDFERCLVEPMANRPDDILETILICFLNNLKPGMRNNTAENIQSHISNHITEMLTTTSEWTVWDRPWPINEENRGGCCIDDPHRLELGRLRYHGEPAGERAANNPLKRVEEQGGGLFELDWRERARLLRQLVDWQLAHAESIRAIVNQEWKVAETSKKKSVTAKYSLPDDAPPIKVEPIGHTRDRMRVWSVDSSWHLWKSGNPFKRPCPMIALTTTKDEYLALIELLEAYGDKSQDMPGGGKVTNVHRRLVKGIQDEGKLAVALKERVEVIEKEEARVTRAKKRIAAVVQAQQAAEMRSTRTRRPNRKVDYSYGDSEDDEDEPPRKSARTATTTSFRRARDPSPYMALDSRGRPTTTIPGERRSARQSLREAAAQAESSKSASPEDAPEPAAEDDDGKEKEAGAVENGNVPPNKPKVKGYAWVEEVVPYAQLSEKDKEQWRKQKVEEDAEVVPVEGQEVAEVKQNGHAAEVDADVPEVKPVVGVNGEGEAPEAEAMDVDGQ